MAERRLCVFCGSGLGARAAYRDAACRLGELICDRGLVLVYGGANAGLMGILADTVLRGGGKVIGVIPEGLLASEVTHPGLTELHRVGSMHERKALMMELSDAFVALPGGYGTLDELTEAVTWAQLRLHDKPCGLLNVEGFFDPLIAYLDRAVREGFLKLRHRALVTHDSDPGRLLDRLLNGTRRGCKDGAAVNWGRDPQ